MNTFNGAGTSARGAVALPVLFKACPGRTGPINVGFSQATD